MAEIDKLVRQHLLDLIPYSSARDEYSGNQGVFLDANENAIGSIGMGHWNRYPDPYQKEIKHTLAISRELGDQNVFIGNGSDEPIDLLIRAFCEPGKDEVLVFPPTYGMYSVSASINNVHVNQVQLTEDFEIDVEGFLKAVNKNTKIVFICSPNNPTANSINPESIKIIVEKSPGLVVIDEAYIDFSYKESWSRKVKEYNNLIVLQTFSKAWGLASLRLGVAYGDQKVITILSKIKPPYNVSGPVQEMIINALRYQDVKRSWVERLNREKEKLIVDLNELEMVEKVYPSDANFLLVKFKKSKKVFKHLTKSKIIVRDRSNLPLCDNCIRITVGIDHENNKLLQALKSF